MTLAEALQYASGRLDAAANLMTAIRDQVAAQLAATTGNATTIINNFINRPPVRQVFFDPVNGNDDNDGSTIALARKTIDAILSTMGSNATTILMLGDGVIRGRYTVSAPLYLAGIQQSADGFILYRRKLTWLGTAINSPQPAVGSFCAGMWFDGPTLRLTQVDLQMPDVPAGVNARDFITSNIGLTVNGGDPSVTLSSQQAGFLFAAQGGHITVNWSPTLGSGVAGHLFYGIAAGANPNAAFQYDTNTTAG